MAQAKAAISRAMATTTWVTSFPPGGQLPVPSAQAPLRLPAHSLDLGRQLLQAELAGPVH